MAPREKYVDGIWMPAKIREGPPVPCRAGDGMVEPGQWQKGYRLGGWYQVFHDACAEDMGAYGEDYAIGGKYGTKDKKEEA